MKLATAAFWTALVAFAAGCGSSDSGGSSKGGGGTAGTATGGSAGTATGGAAGAAAGGMGGNSGSGGTTSGGSGGAGGSSASGGTTSGGGAGGSGGGTSCSSATPGPCGDDGTAWPTGAQTLECKAIEVLNQKRAAGVTCGTTDMPPVGALTRDQVLTDNARAHSQDMATNNYFDLTKKDGTLAMDWSMAGYCGQYVTAEIGGGQADANTFVLEQLNAPTECMKLMAAGAKGVGVGYYTDTTGQSVHMWTLVVGNKP